MPTTSKQIDNILKKYNVSSKDRKWVREHIVSHHLQILSSAPDDLFIFSSVDNRKVNWLVSVAEFVVQRGKVIPKEYFNPNRSGLIIIRPGSIHIYVV